MVDPVGLVGLLVVVAVNTLVAAVGVRFFRIRMNTDWGTVLVAGLFVPLVLVVSTLVLSGLVGLGGSLGTRNAGIVVAFVVPLVVGISIDLFWMPHPDEVELPDTVDEGPEAPDDGGTD